MTKIQKLLFEKQDLVFKKFQAKLNPTVDEKTIIGVRVPQLRAMAKNIFSDAGQFNIEKFFNSVPHKYFEENFIHCLLIEQIKDFDECISRLDKFLPFIDNWAVCDTCRPKVFKKNPEKVLVLAKKWIRSPETYTVRYGIGVFMCYFLNENFSAEYLKIVAAIKSDEYYINMMIAWYFATALAKQWDAAIKIIEEKCLSPWVHNKTIQKARESFRITKEQKEYLLTLKV